MRRTLRFFYHLNVIEDTTTTSTSIVVIVSANQEAIQVPEGTVIEKRVPNLLSLLESHVSEAAPEISVVPRPPTPAPSPQIDPVDNKRNKWGCFRGGDPRRNPSEQTRGSKAT